MDRMLRRGLLLCYILTVPFLVPIASAQAPEPEAQLLAFQLIPEATVIDVVIGRSTTIELTLLDESTDSPNPIIPGSGQEVPTITGHSTKFEIIPLEPRVGWSVEQPPSKFTGSGQQVTVPITVQAFPTAMSTTYPFTVKATMTANGMETNRTVSMVATTEGMTLFTPRIVRSYQVAPGEIVNLEYVIDNKGIYPRVFGAEVTDNPCHAWVAPPRATAIDGQSTGVVSMTIRAPSDRLYYNSESCSISLSVYPVDDPSRAQGVFLGVQVTGVYVPTEWYINTAIAAILLILLILIVKRRKERIEEEILGKPQAPWTIPSEALYLSRLKEEDPRAWYVVRHFLMEDEYRSALLWFKHEKKATKGTRKKERLVVAQEKGLERYDKKWARRIAAPARAAEKQEAKLQKRLDRKSRKVQRKKMRKYSKQVAKLDDAYDKQTDRAEAKWEKQMVKARKKGLPEPERPIIEAPDYPPQPVPEPTLLADHRWSAKAEKGHARAARKSSRIEARYERARARQLRKVQKKVRRIARKIDDPAFVDEHPLLSG